MGDETLDGHKVSHSIKPELEDVDTSGGSWVRSIVSLLLYIGIYYLFFRHDISWIFILTAIVLLHEAGHFAAMKFFGYKDVQMFFIPFLGGFVSGESLTASQKQKVITLFAGPLPGILSGVIIIGLLNNQADHEKLQAFGLLLVGLNAFNLLPIKPLDGGQLLQKLMVRHWQVLQIIFIAGCTLALFAWAVKTFNYLLLVPSWFLIYRLRKIWTLYSIRKEMQRQNISFNTTYDFLSDEQYIAIRKIVIPRIFALRNIEVDEIDNPDEIRVALWVDRVLVPPMKEDMNTQEKTLALFAWIFFGILSVYMLVRFYNYLHIFR